MTEYPCFGCKKGVLCPNLERDFICPDCREMMYEWIARVLDPSYDKDKAPEGPSNGWQTTRLGLLWPIVPIDLPVHPENAWETRYVLLPNGKYQAQRLQEGMWRVLEAPKRPNVNEPARPASPRSRQRSRRR